MAEGTSSVQKARECVDQAVMYQQSSNMLSGDDCCHSVLKLREK